jgi:hypothetical protein
MKRIKTFLFIVVLPGAMATAQIQLENPGFEQWEDILVSETDTIREPVDWSSLKTSDDQAISNLAPLVCTRSQNAHNGEYSIKLTNVKSFIIANGVATNGRVHGSITPGESYIYTDPEDGKWNTPFTGRPDSIAGWVNYAPQGEDNLQIQVILHQGYGLRPDPDSAENWIGEAMYTAPLNTGGEWVRFSQPFTYNHETIPEYVLVILNSGNGFDPVAGSVLLVDDLEMIYNTPQSNDNRLKQTEAYLYAVDKHLLVLKGLDHSHFQSVNIFDFSGKLLWSATLSSDQIDIAPANLDKGIYLVKLSGKDKIFTQKVLLR